MSLNTTHFGDETAWPLLLKHISYKEQLPVLCRMLCCSSALRAAVAQNCAGQMDISIGKPPCGPAAVLTRHPENAGRYEQMKQWISKHGMLLRSLDVKDAATLGRSLQPVLALQHLQQLALHIEGAAISQLQQLTQLTGLTEVQLKYNKQENQEVMNRSAEVWPLLPLTALTACHLSSSSVQLLGQLQGLTSLLLGPSCSNSTCEELAAALKQLTALQQVTLDRVCCDEGCSIAEQDSFNSDFWCEDDMMSEDDYESDSSSSHHQPGGLLQLLNAVAGHPLRSIALKHVPSCNRALLPLARATQLTYLYIWRCDVQQRDFTSLAQQLTGLQRLTIGSEPGIKNAAVAAIGNNLGHLTRLSLSNIPITKASLPSFVKLSSLVRLSLPGNVAENQRVLQLSCLTNLTTLAFLPAYNGAGLDFEVYEMFDKLRRKMPYCRVHNQCDTL